MRVLHIAAPAPFGGLETVLAGLARGTAREGHQVSVVLTLVPSSAEPAWTSDLREDGVHVEIVSLPARAYLRERAAIRALLESRPVDVVHTHGYRSDVLHAAATRGVGCALVSTAHGFASTDRVGRVYEWLQALAWRRFDAVVAVSEPLRAAILRMGVPAARVTQITNGLAPPRAAALDRAEARQRLGLPQEGAVVGWVGRFSEEKDPALMLQAFAASQRTDATICLVGAGPLEAALRALANDLRLGTRVRFAGAVAGAAELLAAFDLVALSSRTEGTPMVVLEAGAAGVPVASTAVGGVPDLLRHGAGWLVPHGDARALAGAVDEALRDTTAARDSARLLKKRLAALSGSDDWISQYLALYERVGRAGRV